MFRAVIRNGTGTKASFGDFDIGGKTGTSQDYRDAWFVGFTPYYVTGVWMGNDDNTPTRKVTGGSLPALVWKDVMQEAHKGLAPQALPGHMEVEDPAVVAEVQSDGVVDSDPQIEEEEVEDPQPRQKRKRGLFARLFGLKEDTPRRKTRPDGIY
jgi:penicillin-binding protein 1A